MQQMLPIQPDRMVIMPPKARISKELILDKGFEIARNEGIQALTARRLAEDLGCSTRPIYRVYNTMEDLKRDVVERAGQFGMNLIMGSGDEDHPVIDFELRYLNALNREKELFNLLFASGKFALDLEDTNCLFDINRRIDRMKQFTLFEGLTDAQLKRILMDLAIYTHGMTSMLGAKKSEKRISDALSRMLTTLVEWEKQQPGHE